VAHEDGVCCWRWVHRIRCAELTVEAHAERLGRRASLAKAFRLTAALDAGR
jgi:hypothetical protein